MDRRRYCWPARLEAHLRVQDTVDTSHFRKHLSQNVSIMKWIASQASAHVVVDLGQGDNRILALRVKGPQMRGFVQGIALGDIAPEDTARLGTVPLDVEPLGIVPVGHLLHGMEAKRSLDLAEDLEASNTAVLVDFGDWPRAEETHFLHGPVEMGLRVFEEGM
jgi:hypothetical protein